MISSRSIQNQRVLPVLKPDISFSLPPLRYTWMSAGSYDDASFFPELNEVGKFEYSRDYNVDKAYKYCEAKTSRVAHICCGSVQPWYEIPKDVGNERIKGAG